MCRTRHGSHVVCSHILAVSGLLWVQAKSQYSETALMPLRGVGVAMRPLITLRPANLWQAPSHTSAQPV